MTTDLDLFWAAHSPGQFYLPGLFSKMLGIPIGTGLIILQLMAVGLAIAGYYLLYVKTFGFSQTVALVACVVMLFQRETLYDFINYSGGPLLMFAATPYFLISSWACLKRRGLYLTIVPLIFLVGAFLKLSFVLIALSLIMASVLWRVLNRERFSRRYLVLQSTLDVFPFLIFYALLYWVHISRGWTAAHLSTGTSFSKATFLFAYSLAAIESGMMSVFWSLARLGSPFHFLEPQLFHSVPFLWAIVLTALAATSLAIMWAVFLSRSIQQDYRVLLASLAVVHVVVLTSLLLGGSLIAEDRHFWPVSAVLLPGLVFIIATMRSSWWRSVLTVVITMQLAYSVAAFGIALERANQASKSRYLAISYPGVPQQLIDAVERLDTNLTTGRNVFFFTDPSLGLLVRRNAVFVSTNAATSFEAMYASDKVDRLILVLDENIIRRKTLPVIESRFEGATNWQAVSWGSYEILCSGCNRFGTTSLRGLPADE